MEHVLFVVGLLIASTVFALLEVQIEGPNGWAADLPCWTVDNRWTRVFFAGRPLTGYHFYLHLFVLTLTHLPFLLSLAPWTPAAELRIVAFIILFFVIEDFLWFVFNPAFGVRRFRGEQIWWHRKSWWWLMPRDYWIAIPIAVGLYVWSWNT